MPRVKISRTRLIPVLVLFNTCWPCHMLQYVVYGRYCLPAWLWMPSEVARYHPTDRRTRLILPCTFFYKPRKNQIWVKNKHHPRTTSSLTSFLYTSFSEFFDFIIEVEDILSNPTRPSSSKILFNHHYLPIISNLVGGAQ